jgi:hypothetical protein
MVKKQENLLGLPEVNPDLSMETRASMASLDAGNFLTRDRWRMLDLAYRQRMGMTATAIKTHYGMRKIAEVGQYALSVFDETLDRNMEVKRRAYGTDRQHYIDEFVHHMTQVTAQQISGAEKVCAAVIAEIITESPYPEVEEPKSFFRRLLGG